MTITLNGGLKTHAECQAALQKLDGVMVGREVFQNPMFLAEVDQLYFDSSDSIRGRVDLLNDYLDYRPATRAECVFKTHDSTTVWFIPGFTRYQGMETLLERACL